MIGCSGAQHLELRDAHFGLSVQVAGVPTQLMIRLLIVIVRPHRHSIGPQI
jgi:hypothetical protein